MLISIVSFLAVFTVIILVHELVTYLLRGAPG